MDFKWIFQSYWHYCFTTSLKVSPFRHLQFSRSRMMMIMMMYCFCDMVDRREAYSLIFSRDHCQRSSSSRISDTPGAGFEPAHNLSLGFVEWSCAVVITLHHGATFYFVLTRTPCTVQGNVKEYFPCKIIVHAAFDIWITVPLIMSSVGGGLGKLYLYNVVILTFFWKF